MNDPIRHEIELGEDVQLMLYCNTKTESDEEKNIHTLSSLIFELLGDKNYLLIQAPGKFFTNFLVDGHILRKNGSYDLLDGFTVTKPNTDINWMVFFSRINNLIVYEFNSKYDLENSLYKEEK